MANPRVFISSTCYDLSEVRDSLVEFVKSFGFEPVLSERGDVFYHPDIHTQDSCLNEVSNCQLFVLIIGGRFGGSYVADKTKSIVNAEYSAAREKMIPVFTFVKKNVHADHHVFQKNNTNPSLKDIVFPSLEKNEHATSIFSFIDDVRNAPTNNGIFPFDFAREIISLLRKQWSGMFFELLESRSSQNQLKTATGLLKNISIAGEKVEELVKSLYRHLDAAGAEKIIDVVELHSIARKFFETIFTDFRFARGKWHEGYINLFAITPRTGKWYEYIANATGGTVDYNSMSENAEGDFVRTTAIYWGNYAIDVDSPNVDYLHKQNLERQKYFEIIQPLSNDEIKGFIEVVDFLC